MEKQDRMIAVDAAAEQKAIHIAVERAKALRDILEALGLSYQNLLALEALRGDLGDIGHNILLGWYRGEGWPEEAT